MTIRLTDAEINHLVPRFQSLDLGEWDRSAVERATAGLGWTVRSGDDTWLRFEGPLSDGWAFASRGHDHGSPREGCFTLLECQLAHTEDKTVLEAVFEAGRKAIEACIGPAPIRRGPGPVLRWRREETLLELEWGRDEVRLALLSAAVVENHEYQVSRWSERDDAVAELGVWQAFGLGRAGMKDVFLPGGRLAQSWEEFGPWLEETLSAMVRDMGRLDDELVLVMRPSTDEDNPNVVQLICNGRMLHLEASTAVLSPSTLADLGWRRGPEAEFHVLDFPHPQSRAAESAARTLVDTLRAQDVHLDDLRHRAWLNRSDCMLFLHGLGLETL
ncbi:TY-Chap domain-containing protein [Embleya sp. NPDC020630]|uniref:TY-Chap domain-containing protein n=1 Tax=Embleya sp. NPDC020630 TaxID=3363979 RepID=UPI0037A4B683